MADWLEIIKESFHSDHIKRNEGVGDKTVELFLVTPVGYVSHLYIVHVKVCTCTM